MLQDIQFFLSANWDTLTVLLVSLWASAEAITRLTPTKTDDGFVTRVGLVIDKLLSFLPNKVQRKTGDDAFKK